MFSIWHAWALSIIESPFVKGGPCNHDDLFRALLICSMSRNEYIKICNSETEVDKLIDIALKYAESEREERDNTKQNIESYLQDCLVMPDFFSDGSSDPVKDRVRCPIEWHMVFFLVSSRLALTEDEAWDYPYARCQCWQAVKGEQGGSKAYVDKRDREDFKKSETA